MGGVAGSSWIPDVFRRRLTGSADGILGRHEREHSQEEGVLQREKVRGSVLHLLSLKR